jgi:hypothetical protein
MASERKMRDLEHVPVGKSQLAGIHDHVVLHLQHGRHGAVASSL